MIFLNRFLGDDTLCLTIYRRFRSPTISCSPLPYCPPSTIAEPWGMGSYAVVFSPAVTLLGHRVTGGLWKLCGTMDLAMIGILTWERGLKGVIFAVHFCYSMTVGHVKCKCEPQVLLRYFIWSSICSKSRMYETLHTENKSVNSES